MEGTAKSSCPSLSPFLDWSQRVVSAPTDFLKMAASFKVRSPSPTQTQLNPLYASLETDAVTRHRGGGLPGETSRTHNHSGGPHYDEATITKDNQNPVYGERFELDDRSGSKTNIALTTKDENKPLCQYCSFVLALILGIFALLVSFVAIILCALVVGGTLVDREDVVVVGLRNSIVSLQSAVSDLDNSTSCVNVSVCACVCVCTCVCWCVYCVHILTCNC